MRLPPDLRAQLIEVYHLNLELAYAGKPAEAKHEAVAEIAAQYGIHPDRLRARLQQQAKPKPVITENTCNLCGKAIGRGRVTGLCFSCYGATHICIRCGRRLHPMNKTGICARCECGLDDIWRAR